MLLADVVLKFVLLGFHFGPGFFIQVRANGVLYKARVIRGLYMCERCFYDASVWNVIYEIRVSIDMNRGL